MRNVRVRDRRGVSLAELLASLVLLALGGSLATRLLIDVAGLLERAELGLRATLFLAELRDGPVEGERSAGPGTLVPDASAGEGTLRVRFEPSDPDAVPSRPGPRGFRASRTWMVGGDP